MDVYYIGCPVQKRYFVTRLFVIKRISRHFRRDRMITAFHALLRVMGNGKCRSSEVKRRDVALVFVTFGLLMVGRCQSFRYHGSEWA